MNKESFIQRVTELGYTVRVHGDTVEALNDKKEGYFLTANNGLVTKIVDGLPTYVYVSEKNIT